MSRRRRFPCGARPVIERPEGRSGVISTRERGAKEVSNPRVRNFLHLGAIIRPSRGTDFPRRARGTGLDGVRAPDDVSLLRLHRIVTQTRYRKCGVWIVCRERFRRLASYHLYTVLRRSRRQVGWFKSDSDPTGTDRCSEGADRPLPHGLAEQMHLGSTPHDPLLDTRAGGCSG